MSAWQPIKTAPKDGTRFLGYTIERSAWSEPRYRYEEVWWSGKSADDRIGRFASVSGNIVTHWMPLPEPPESK